MSLASKCPLNFVRGQNRPSPTKHVMDFVGNVPDMSWTCPMARDMSGNPTDRIGWLAIFLFFNFVARSKGCGVQRSPKIKSMSSNFDEK